MIDAKTLKKHNLKAVPFSCVGEGETFNLGHHIRTLSKQYERRLVGRTVDFTDGIESNFIAWSLRDMTVYVPVWRPCRKPHLMEAWGYKPLCLDGSKEVTK